MALAHAFAAAAASREEWTRLAAGWDKARPFVLKHVPTVDANWLDVRLLAEAQTCVPAQSALSISDHDVDYEIEAWEHWCEAVNAVEQPVAPKAWPFETTIDENGRTARRGDAKVAFGGNEKPWLVFMALLRRHPGYYKTLELGHDVWNPDSGNYGLDDYAVHRVICDLRKTYLAPLGLGVKHTRGIGYQLQERTAAAATPSRAKRSARRKSSR
jgi:hypothetical protein